jgi:hypothetical protein
MTFVSPGFNTGRAKIINTPPKQQAIKKAKSEDFAFLAVTSATLVANKLSNIR